MNGQDYLAEVESASGPFTGREPLSENLFEAPRELPSPAPAPEGSEAHALRSAHLPHEGALRGMGSLLFWGGLFVTLGGLSLGFVVLVAMAMPPHEDVLAEILAVVLVGGLCGGAALPAAVIATAGRRLSRMQRGAQVWFYGVGVFILFFFPVGSVLGSYLLWLLHCDAGKVVLSEPYAAAIEATPYLQAPRLWWARLLTLVLGLTVGLAALGTVMVVIALSLDTEPIVDVIISR